MNIDAVIKSTVESVAENTTDWAVAPIFWSAIFGGLGGILYRTVNIIDNTVGYKTDTYINFGKFPQNARRRSQLYTARIAALLMKMNVSYLHLSARTLTGIQKRQKENPLVLIQLQTQSVCAGALGIQLGSDEYYGGQLVRKPVIGRNLKPCEPNDIFWANQLLLGTSFYAMLFTAVIRTALFFVI